MHCGGEVRDSLSKGGGKDEWNASRIPRYREENAQPVEARLDDTVARATTGLTTAACLRRPRRRGASFRRVDLSIPSQRINRPMEKENCQANGGRRTILCAIYRCTGNQPFLPPPPRPFPSLPPVRRLRDFHPVCVCSRYSVNPSSTRLARAKRCHLLSVNREKRLRFLQVFSPSLSLSLLLCILTSRKGHHGHCGDSTTSEACFGYRLPTHSWRIRGTVDRLARC